MRMFLNGEWVDRAKQIEVRDPFDGSLVDTVPAATGDDVETAMEAARRGFEVARRMTVYDRAQVLYRAAVVVGHCRYATHGSPRDNRNNHPHPAGSGQLMHNGVVHSRTQGDGP